MARNINTTTAAPAAKTRRTTRTAQHAASIESATEVHSADVVEEDPYVVFQRAADRLAAHLNIGTGPRAMIGWIIGVLVATGAGYLVGTAALILMIAAGIATYSFIWWLLALVTIVVGAYVGGKLGNMACEYIVDGHASRHVAQAKGWVRGLFSFGAKPEAAGC